MALNTKVQADHHAPPITRLLAEFAIQHPSKGWDQEVEDQAHRTLANWLGCAIGASSHDSVQAALAAAQVLESPPQAALMGRAERVDMANAALINGISSHTFDFDDTHLKTIIHPAGPIASALLPLAEKLGSTGRQVIDALVIGVEVSCRVGNCMYPHHYDRGWHITGTTGMVGSAAACSRLLGLSVNQAQMALGIAASQPVGLREQFGSMTKPFHPGAAAKNGLMSALLAQKGFTSSKRALEAPRGLIQAISDKHDWSEITEGLGSRWEAALNTYKPFACGIVIHPSIDGCVQLRNAHQLQAEDISGITLKVHSLVLELTGKKTPQLGLEGKFSVYHSCAAGIIHGRAGEHEYSDACVQDARVVTLRDKITAVVDDSISEASADVTIQTNDGRSFHVFVEHAIGSLERPMSAEQLKAKFMDQAAAEIGQDKAENAWNAALGLAQAPNIMTLLKAATR
ncbi:2-methylcitrate dehydratase [Burkholderiales bacterium]